jgi:hypothetical protein
MFWLSLWYLLAIGLSVFFELRILAISFVSFCHCVVCLLRFTDSGYLFCIFLPLVCLCSSIYEFWWSLWNLLAIVLSLFFDLHILVISLVSFGHCVFCLLRFKDSAISLVSVGHCVVCLLRFKVSWNIFGICCPLCCLSSSIYGFWLSVLVYVCHCVVCLLRFTYSCYLFGICWPLCCLSSLIYIFWFFLLYLLAIVLSVFFDLRFLGISLVCVAHCVVCFLRFTYSGYLFGICLSLCCLSSSIYIFWLSLWYLLAIVLSVFFDLHMLAISLVSVGHCVVYLLRFTCSGYLFGIFWPLVCLSSSI